MISIIVPVYNVEQYLRACLDSLFAQTFKDIEIICINDGSTDASGTVLSDYTLKDNRLRVITQPNSGVSASRNRGIEESKGTWLMFVDSDDWIDSDTCETAFNAAVKCNADLVFWSYIREYENGKSSLRYLMDSDNKFEGKELRILHRKIIGPVGNELCDPSLLHSWGTVWGKLYKRETISEVKFTDTHIVGSAEDALFNAEIFNNIGKAVYLHNTKYHYRKQNISFTGGYNKFLNERWNVLYGLFSKMIATYNLPTDFSEALDNRIALGLIGQGLNECNSPKTMAGKIKTLKQIITTEQYRKSITNLEFKYFPIHWKLFFLAAKNTNAFALFIFLLAIGKLK